MIIDNMFLGINFNNQSNSSGLDLKKIKQEDDISLSKSKLSKKLTYNLSKRTNDIIGINAQPVLNKDNILQLQELREHSANLLAPQAPEQPEKVNLGKEINLNGTPRLSWLIGRDDNLYNRYISRLSNGAETMKDFSIVIDKIGDNKFIPLEVHRFLREHIQSFQRGFNSQQKAKDATDDPIVHKVIDYVMPKTQARLQLLQDYLNSKELDPKYEYKSSNVDFTLKEVGYKPSFTSINSDISFASKVNSDNDYSKRLLEFLAKDLRWYDWYLRDDASEPFESLPLTKASSLADLVLSRIKDLPVAAPAA